MANDTISRRSFLTAAGVALGIVACRPNQDTSDTTIDNAVAVSQDPKYIIMRDVIYAQATANAAYDGWKNMEIRADRELREYKNKEMATIYHEGAISALDVLAKTLTEAPNRALYLKQEVPDSAKGLITAADLAMDPKLEIKLRELFTNNDPLSDTYSQIASVYKDLAGLREEKGKPKQIGDNYFTAMFNALLASSNSESSNYVCSMILDVPLEYDRTSTGQNFKKALAAFPDEQKQSIQDTLTGYAAHPRKNPDPKNAFKLAFEVYGLNK